MNSVFADDLAAALPTSGILKQLATLDLSMGALSDTGVAAMAVARYAFAHLERLDLSDNALTDASLAASAGLARTVVFGDRHDPDRAAKPDPESRYVSVGE